MHDWVEWGQVPLMVLPYWSFSLLWLKGTCDANIANSSTTAYSETVVLLWPRGMSLERLEVFDIDFGCFSYNMYSLLVQILFTLQFFVYNTVQLIQY